MKVEELYNIDNYPKGFENDSLLSIDLLQGCNVEKMVENSLKNYSEKMLNISTPLKGKKLISFKKDFIPSSFKESEIEYETERIFADYDIEIKPVQVPDTFEIGALCMLRYLAGSIKESEERNNILKESYSRLLAKQEKLIQMQRTATEAFENSCLNKYIEDGILHKFMLSGKTIEKYLDDKYGKGETNNG